MKNQFNELQDKISSVAAALGGEHFTKCIVAKAAARYLNKLVEDRMTWDERRHLTFSAWLFATEDDFVRTIAALENTYIRHLFPEQENYITAESDQFMDGRLVLRGHELRFETHTAGFYIARIVPDYPLYTNWNVWINEDTANPLLDALKLSHPAVYRSNAKSEDGGIKSLKRISEQTFKKPLVAISRDCRQRYISNSANRE